MPHNRHIASFIALVFLTIGFLIFFDICRAQTTKEFRTAGSSSTALAPASSSQQTDSKVGMTDAVSNETNGVSSTCGVIVLGYHQFTGPSKKSKNIYVMSQDVFETEMQFLKENGYHVVSLEDLLHFLKHEISLPTQSVAITIDDGYKSVVTYAAPVLKNHGYPWTFFVYTDFIGTSSQSASWQDLLNLQADGVDIECHSKDHPFLNHKNGKTPEQYDQWLTDEIVVSKSILEQKLGKPIHFFAYPYGAYNQEVQTKIIDAGYDGIFTVANNPVYSTTSPFSIGRYVITKGEEKLFAAFLREGVH